MRRKSRFTKFANDDFIIDNTDTQTAHGFTPNNTVENNDIIYIVNKNKLSVYRLSNITYCSNIMFLCSYSKITSKKSFDKSELLYYNEFLKEYEWD